MASSATSLDTDLAQMPLTGGESRETAGSEGDENDEGQVAASSMGALEVAEELVRLESGELRPTAVELYAARALIGLDGIGPNNEKSKNCTKWIARTAKEDAISLHYSCPDTAEPLSWGGWSDMEGGMDAGVARHATMNYGPVKVHLRHSVMVDTAGKIVLNRVQFVLVNMFGTPAFPTPLGPGRGKENPPLLGQLSLRSYQQFRNRASSSQ